VLTTACAERACNIGGALCHDAETGTGAFADCPVTHPAARNADATELQRPIDICQNFPTGVTSFRR